MNDALQHWGDQLGNWHFHILALSLGAAFFIEGVRPAVPETSERARWMHVGRNIGLWLLGYGFVDVLIFSQWLGAREGLELAGWGFAQLPAWAALTLGVLLLDCLDYWLHRVSHHVRPLWLLHSVHHSDPQVDATTALRAHPGEVLTGRLLTWGILAALGMPLWVYAFRAALQLPIAILHHANWHLPARLERVLEWFIVTPSMHRLHHSPLEHETNSNYAQTFSVWDRLFGTYRNPRAAEATRDSFGLERLRESSWQSIAGLLKTPFAARRFDRF
jgi:sterol desaturase/sphingolipid hydroxylase (fatty acid hydroxylase superfamily)